MRHARMLPAFLFCGMLAGVANGRDIAIHIKDLATGNAVAGASVTWQVDRGKKQDSLSDDAGHAALQVPDAPGEHGLLVQVWVKKPGMVTLRQDWWPKKSGDSPPTQMTFALEPATRISGRVLQEDGTPLPGAHVVVEVKKTYPGLPQRVSLSAKETLTDNAGKWEMDGVPATCDAIALAVWDHLHLTEDGFYVPQPFEPQAKLRDGTAQVVLQRSTLIEGLVTGPDGKPVENATVYYNPDRRVGNGIPPIKANAAGQFELGIKPGLSALLEVERPGLAPARVQLNVGAVTPQKLHVPLKNPSLLSGRVVDAAGKGVEAATIWIHGWNRRDLLDKKLKTDADGRFAWNEAPDEEITLDVYNTNGLAPQNDVKVKAGDKNEIVETPTTAVELTVLDAATGQPITDFHVGYGAVWQQGSRLIWQGDEPDKVGKRRANVFSYEFTTPIYQSAMRVSANGYYPTDTPLFRLDGGTKKFTTRLEKGTPLLGRAHMPDGTPAGEGAVYFISDSVSLSNGDLDSTEKESAVHGTLDKEGHFTLQPQHEKGLLLAITANGVGFWNIGEWETRNDFPLQPWSRLEGRFMKGAKPLASADVIGLENEIFPSNALPQVRWQYGLKTDGEGHFSLDHVWPGHVRFLKWIPNHAGHQRFIDVTLGQVDLPPGKTTLAQIGGTGRPVVGRLAMDFIGKPWMIRTAEARPATDPKDWKYNPEIADDGSFRIDDMPPGNYLLKIALHEPPPGDDCGWGRVLGDYTATFTVPELPGGAPGEQPLDLGLLPSLPVPAETLKVGDRAPDFTVKTADGKEIKRADLQGKVVLLDFWATWCAPCVAELPHVREIAAAHADDPHFALLGMDEDEDPAAMASMTKAMAIHWPQAMLGEDSPVARQYGATAIPATILIGPDGKVLARDLRGDALKKAINDALAAR